MAVHPSLTQAIDNLTNNAELTHYFEHIPSKNTKSKKGFLESVVILAYILYALEDETYLLIVNELAQIEFFHDYDYWTWIECAICLLALYHQSHNQIDQYLLLKNKLDNVLTVGETDLILEVKNNVHQRFLAGEMLDKARVLQAIENKKEKDEINGRIVFLMNLVKSKVYRQESSVNEAYLDDEISENTLAIRKFIQENGFKKIFPFA